MQLIQPHLYATTGFIPDEIKEKYENADWKGIVGLRNRIAHEYFDISLSIVWHIVMKELPTLEDQMKEILEQS